MWHRSFNVHSFEWCKYEHNNIHVTIFNRDQWKGYVAPYHPVFLDGWSPEYPVADDRDHMPSAIGAGVNTTTAAGATEGTRTRGEDVSRKLDVQDLNISAHKLGDLNTAFF
jgi:hypothetical protein